MRKSQIVFDEVGYNVSQEVKDLIYSIDGNGAFGSSDEALLTRVSELESELAEEKAHNAELRETVVAQLEEELASTKARNIELESELEKALSQDLEDDRLEDDRR
jgi:hypothetical protein